MTGNEDVLRLIIIEESQNDAEAIANILRNAGHVVRYHYADSLEATAEGLEQQLPDLIILAQAQEAVTMNGLRELLDQHCPETPVIFIGDTAEETQIIAALETGAADLVTYDQPDHLRLVVAREQANLLMRRELQHFRICHEESEKRCRSLLDSSRDAIAYVHDGMHIYANQSYLEMFGFDDLEEIEGHPIMDMVAPDDTTRFKEFLRNYNKQEQKVDNLEVQCISVPRGNFKAVMEFCQASIEGEVCTQIVIRDQASGDPELAQKLQFLSKQDILTGLYNRQYFLEEVELAASDAQAGSAESYLLYVLLDNFKGVKDTVGLVGSDIVIKDIADLIRDKLGEQGLAARFGDNSFTLLLRQGDLNAAQALAEALRHAIEEHIFDIEGRTLTITSSIGISPVTENVPDAHEAISRADLACEVARSAGGNRVHLHNPVTDEQLGREREQQWKQAIIDALEQNRFSLMYQPIVSLQGDPAERYEILLRMRDGDGEEVPPGQFLPVARQTGQIVDIDRWVIGEAVTRLAERRREGHDTIFFVKLSGPTLEDPELPLWINEQLKNAHLPGSAMVFEIAEKEAADHLKHTKAFTKSMESIHCKTSLEHFGGGPNSFQLLKHLAVNFLKIDGAYIHNLASDENNQAMVRSILDMAASMQKECIAEFVEDASSLTVLFQLGIPFIQGYFLQEPHPGMDYDFTEESI
ncbi:putative diguanylate phosphodiesterase [Thiohalobacter thiocyanaticus]|uniref:Putative diguanylate phosphodiesterase n=1 Tax=Thiohalobacter thiocyanaticus TaxID=585455 RepID=A0A1Z4VQX9_9GAMM|nr:EAL domain-containing protein [Thiohalobacter thiocyanaticus]BAZ93614.1 putative diguanylate phosphodiesterase [Thiohalobacter thiocyanaticus]